MTMPWHMMETNKMAVSMKRRRTTTGARKTTTTTSLQLQKLCCSTQEMYLFAVRPSNSQVSHRLPANRRLSSTEMMRQRMILVARKQCSLICLGFLVTLLDQLLSERNEHQCPLCGNVDAENRTDNGFVRNRIEI